MGESSCRGIAFIRLSNKQFQLPYTPQISEKEAFSFHSANYQQLTKHEAKWHFYHFSQDKTTSDKAFLDGFTNTVYIVTHCGGDIGTDWEDVIDQLKAMSKTRQDVTDEEIEMAEQRTKDF